MIYALSKTVISFMLSKINGFSFFKHPMLTFLIILTFIKLSSRTLFVTHRY